MSGAATRTMSTDFSTEWVFGYGSLVDKAALAAWLRRGAFGPGETAPCRLRGWRRTWNVARDNGEIAAGRPHYVDARTGARAALFVTVLNIRPAAGESVNGLAFRVSRAERERLDRREFNYDRIDAAGSLDRALGGRVWVYRGSAAARARYERGAGEGRAVVARRYFESVEAAFASLGPEALAEYRASTDRPASPLADLRRTDWSGS